MTLVVRKGSNPVQSEFSVHNPVLDCSGTSQTTHIRRQSKKSVVLTKKVRRAFSAAETQSFNCSFNPLETQSFNFNFTLPENKLETLHFERGEIWSADRPTTVRSSVPDHPPPIHFSASDRPRPTSLSPHSGASCCGDGPAGSGDNTACGGKGNFHSSGYPTWSSSPPSIVLELKPEFIVAELCLTYFQVRRGDCPGEFERWEVSIYRDEIQCKSSERKLFSGRKGDDNCEELNASSVVK
ncbi:hypothetical protein B0H16DRAFT_1473469 [Mycena metata]|uniref:Uncharacterized protein n=1 Tax=Mycena metata TaxID=1033252 RepID=A0AAD7HJJ5_9AGAR|nr:hypothetical protein B0H16DRAFT_1473469 [Mycena metata]